METKICHISLWKHSQNCINTLSSGISDLCDKNIKSLSWTHAWKLVSNFMPSPIKKSIWVFWVEFGCYWICLHEERQQAGKAGLSDQETDYILSTGLSWWTLQQGENEWSQYRGDSIVPFTSETRKAAASTFSAPFPQHNVRYKVRGHTCGL